jgi:hypothetical protein
MCAIAPCFGIWSAEVERRYAPWTLSSGFRAAARAALQGVMGAQHGVHDGVRGQLLLGAALHVLERGLPVGEDRDVAGARSKAS